MNTEQKKYIQQLDYEYTGNPEKIRSNVLSESMKRKLSSTETIGDLLDAITDAHFFGEKDSVILSLLK